MCGIVGYIGPKNAVPIVLTGLKRLEYRGYDSAGIAYIQNNNLIIQKKSGKVKTLENSLSDNLASNICIGHTRWATHGSPSDLNAHPHMSMNKHLAIIHNGVIENYLYIKEGLIKRGYKFNSATDTEVLINLIEDVQKNEKTNLFKSIQLALSQVIGAYSLVVIDKNNPQKLIVAKKGSPLLIGVGNKENFIDIEISNGIKKWKTVSLKQLKNMVLKLSTNLKKLLQSK